MLKSPPRSPMANAICERVIGTIRRECLDHVIIFSEAALYRHVKTFTAYYHGCRTHLSLAKDSPEPRAVQPPELGRIVATPQVDSITVTSDAQPENVGDNVCPHKRGVRLKAFSSLIGRQSSVMASH